MATGAGTSIVVDSLALLAGGGRHDAVWADVLTVVGVFEPVGVGWREVRERAGIPGGPTSIVWTTC